MAFVPATLPSTQDTPPNEWKLSSFSGGVVYTNLPQDLADNQSPDMLNMWFREKALTKRFGQEWVTTSLGNFPVYACYHKQFNNKIIFAASTKLYEIDATTGIVTEIYNGITAIKGSFFEFNDILYYKNGYQYIQYNGTTATPVVGYIPTVIIGRSPTGGGTTYEQYNMLAAGFRNSFSPTGSTAVFTLTQTNLDATPVTATLLGVTKVEGVDFTVDRTTGVVTFGSNPPSGTDTLIITAYKTDTVSYNAIMATKYTITFGGDNDTRVFTAGGSNTYYYSGLQDPTFFPEDQYNNAGVDGSQIYGFGKTYDTLIVFKSDSMYSVTYSFNGTTVSFPMAQLNNTNGCDMPWTIQNINDNLVWSHSEKGVQILTSTLIKSEKNVASISDNINGTMQHTGLLNNSLSTLQDASSFDMWGMYWICVGSTCYCWDYATTNYVNSSDTYSNARRLAWYPLDNINANCFFSVDGELFTGDRSTARISHFTNNYSDFGVAINGYWKSKLLDFQAFDWKKVIPQLRYATKCDVSTRVTTEYTYDDGYTLDSETDTKSDYLNSFTWSHLRWDTFTWNVINYAAVFVKYPKIKNTIYFAVKFSNNTDGENLSLLNLDITWLLFKRTK